MGPLRDSRAAFTVGTLATLFYLLFSWVPSFWFDESATVSAVRRTPAELMDLLGNIDAVHGAYYFMMQAWTSVFGVSEFALRVPSAIAGGVTAALVYAIAARLDPSRLDTSRQQPSEPVPSRPGPSRYALIAAGLFTILPRVQYAALEARPFVFSLALGTLATWALVRIWATRGSRTAGFWSLYAIAGALGVLFSFYTVLLIAAHALALLCTKELRRRWLPFLASGLIWAIPALIVAIIAYGQRAQVAWIRPVTPSIVIEYLLAQYSSRMQFLDGLAPVPYLSKLELIATVLFGAVLFLAALIGAWRMRRRFLFTVAATWMLAPVILLLLGSLILGSAYYLPRYLTFTAPAIALLAAAAFIPAQKPLPSSRRSAKGPVRSRRLVALLAGLALIFAAVPASISLRSEGGKDASFDYKWVADTVAANAQPGDAIAPMGGDPNLIVRSYPDRFAGLGDPTFVDSAGSIDALFDSRVGIATAADRVLEYERIWLIREKYDDVSPADLATLGYIPGREYIGDTRVVTEYVRTQ